jgi:hypothetical protein
VLSNTVLVSGHDDEGDTATAAASDSLTYQDVAPSISISKSPSASSLTVGGVVTYSYTVRNTSAASTDPVTITSLSDDKTGDLLAAFYAANGNSYVLAPGASITFTSTYTTTTAGTLKNTVTANGHDDENDTATANNSATVTVLAASPTISTQIQVTGDGTVGSTMIGDTATITGGYNHTGTIHFTLDTPSATGLDEGTVPVVAGTSTYSSPYTMLVTQIGTYTWHATYTGDNNNNGPVSDNGSNESLTSKKASRTVSTQIQVTGDGKVGSTTIGDTATISGGFSVAGGTIHFTLDTPSATGVDEGTVPVTGAGTYTAPHTVLVAQVGAYQWHAYYSGDGLNNGGYENDPQNESISITQAQISFVNIGTTIYNAATNVALPVSGGTAQAALGASVYDTTQLSGATSVTPTGMVTYNFYTIASPTYGVTTPFSTQTVTLSANGTVPQSATTAALAAGGYSYIAVYSGDTNYKSAIGPTEPLNVNTATISGYKWDDANGDGKWDTNPLTSLLETGINGVTIQLYNSSNNLVATATTATNGANAGYYSFTISQVGTYTIKEVVPSGSIATTPNPVTVSIAYSATTDSTPSVAGRYGYTDKSNFGDAPVGQSTTGPLTLGYYTNNNGANDLTGSKTGTKLLGGVYNYLFGIRGQQYNGVYATQNGVFVRFYQGSPSSYSVLVDGSGNYLSLAFFQSYANLSAFLKGANASNSANMLSAQLLTTELNVYFNRVNPLQYIYTPNVPGINSAYENQLVAHSDGPFVQIQKLVTDAINELTAAPHPTSGSSDQVYEIALELCFDGINNNKQIFVV